MLFCTTENCHVDIIEGQEIVCGCHVSEKSRKCHLYDKKRDRAYLCTHVTMFRTYIGQRPTSTRSIVSKVAKIRNRYNQVPHMLLNLKYLSCV